MPALVIVDQQSLHKESFTKDGEQKIAHNVVKNTPFVIKVTISNSLYDGAIWDFNRLNLDASLLYDCWEEKPVPYLKNKPIQYQGKVNENADTMTLNIKINVLSSHCENMMFRVKLRALDARTNDEYADLVAFSEPIKVISKPDQLPGKAKPAKASSGTAKPKKRTINDVITESLDAIQQQQREHHELLLKIFEDRNNQPIPVLPLANFDELSNSSRERCLDSLVGSLSASSGEPLGKSANEDENALEKAFHNFIDVYNKVNPEQRPAKIRRIVRNSSARKTDTFCEIVGLFNDEGLQKEVGRECSLTFSPTSMDSTPCSPETCPHKKELERIDEFYRDFLSVSPSALPGDDIISPLPMLFQ